MKENSIEEDIVKKFEEFCEDLYIFNDDDMGGHFEGVVGDQIANTNLGYLIFKEKLEDFLSDYKRVLKENEELKAKWDKDTHILQNKLDYANADRIDLAQQNKELRKENEGLNNRCRNLDTEAQAYLEELAGDNTLTRRTIKQLQEENEELKNDYENLSNSVVVKNYYIENSIPVQKVKDNIKKLEIKKEKVRGERNILERFAIEKSINSLQELLEKRK